MTPTTCATARGCSSARCRCCGSTCKAGAESRLRVTATQLERVVADAATLARSLEAVEATIALTKDVSEDVIALGRRAAELRDDLTFLTRADDPGHVYYLDIRGRGVFLRASPIDVSDVIREMLLDRMVATVLTSATLTVDGRFDYVRSRLGVRHAHEARLASEFDYTRQAILYLPKKMPDPRSPQFVIEAGREVVDILQRTSGRAFVLFTSYANLRQVHQLASAEISYPILVQGSAAAIGAAARLQVDSQRGAVRHVELLAGRRRRRRIAELRHHRQAAVRLAGRSDHLGPDRGDQQRRRQRLCRVTRYRWPSSRCSRAWGG